MKSGFARLIFAPTYKITFIMKKLFLFVLPLLIVSCKGVEQYRAGIEELSGNWDNATKAVTDFQGTVSNDLTNYTTALANVKLDDAVAMKLKPEQKASFEAAQKAVTDALGAYPAFQQTINDFATMWTEKAATVTALKDGLAAGKLEGDVAGQLAELGTMVTTANDNLKAWTESYGAIKGGVDTAMGSLTELMGTFSAAK
jgi:hypothetical protein